MAAQGTQRFLQSGFHQTFCSGYRKIQPDSSTQYTQLLAKSCSNNPCMLQHTFCYASPHIAELGFSTSQHIGKERFPATRRTAAAALQSTLCARTTARLHPLCSRSAMRFCLLALAPKFPTAESHPLGTKVAPGEGLSPVLVISPNTASLYQQGDQLPAPKPHDPS